MSGIIIPMADVAGGRAASPRIADVDRTGQAIAEFGRVMANIGEVMETDRLDREMGRARVDMQRDLGQARIELEASGSPEAINAGWVDRSAALRQRYVDAADPRIRGRIELAFDELSDRHALALGQRAIDLGMSQRRAILDDHVETWVAGAAGTDPETRQAGYDQLADNVAEQLAAGAITPEQAGAILRDARQRGARTVVMGQLDSDPAALLADLDAGGHEDLDPIYREGLRSSARAEIARREAAAQAEADRAAKVRDQAIDDELRQIIGLSGQGIRAAQSGILESDEAKARPLWAEAQAAVDLLAEQPRFGMATVAEIDAMIAAEKNVPKLRAYQAERLKVLEQARARAAEGWSRDPVAFAETAGFRVPELQLDAARPGELAAGLRERAHWGEAAKSQGYGDVVAEMPLSLAEQEEIKRRSGVDQDPASRAALAGELAAGLGAKAATRLSGDPVFGHVAGLVASGAAQALAEEVFRGEQAIAEKTVQLPPAGERLDSAFGVVGDLFASQPGGEALQAQIMAAADALYAARMKHTDPAGDMDPRVWTRALNDVLGGAGDGRTATGGIREVRGRPTALLPGVSAAQVEDAFDWLFVQPGARTHLQGNLAAVSADEGRVPSIGGEPVRLEDMSDLTLRAVGGDRYALVFRNEDGAREQVLADAEGHEYHISLRALLREGAR